MNEIFKCPHCDKITNKHGIKAHIWRVHTEQGQAFVSKHSYIRGSNVSWSKGLTKETSGILEQKARKSKQYYVTNPKKGRQQSDFSKSKISKARIKFLEENPDKVPYLVNHSSKKSYPEQLFEKALIENKIEGWIYNFRNGIYQYDYAFPNLKLDVEIDGGTHSTEKVKKIDEKRDLFSQKNGWKVLRFTAKEIKENVNSCIQILKDFINAPMV